MVRVGIDIGGSSIKIGVIEDTNGEVLSKEAIPFIYGNIKENCSNIKSSIDKLLSANNINLKDVCVIGLGVPGVLDKNKEIILNAYNLGFNNINIKKEFENTFPNTKISIVNDADAAAICEYYFGIFKGKSSAVLLTIGTGLGAGVILSNKLFCGSKNNGIEIGHMKIETKDDLKCTCGSYGCAEIYASAKALDDKMKNLYEQTGDKIILDTAGGEIENINAKTAMDLASKNYEPAVKMVDEWIDYLSSAIVNICLFYDPEVIGLGGGIVASKDYFLPKLIEKVKSKLIIKDDYEIKIAKYENDAGFIGAAFACDM